jgi:hypothetical protein
VDQAASSSKEIIMKRSIQILLIAVIALVLTQSAWAKLEGDELGRVEALLTLLATKSDVIFVRNGKEYSVDKGVSHLRTKLNQTKNRLTTCEEFVDNVASSSSISGKPYLVILPGGETLEMKVYLGGLLREVDAGR